MTGQPSTLRIWRTRSGAIDAPPSAPTRSPEKSVRSTSGCASTSDHCVGTPVAIVMRSSRMSRSDSSADHGSPTSTSVVPFASSSHMRVM